MRRPVVRDCLWLQADLRPESFPALLGGATAAPSPKRKSGKQKSSQKRGKQKERQRREGAERERAEQRRAVPQSILDAIDFKAAEITAAKASGAHHAFSGNISYDICHNYVQKHG